MFKKLAIALLTLSLATMPGAAMAKKKDKDAGLAKPARVYAPVDFNTANDPENLLLLDLSNGQRVTIRLMPDWAPNHVERIKVLARKGFYNGIIFHRVIEDFMAQTGDPTGTGRGSSDLPNVDQEFNDMPHVRGSVSMARAGDVNSANSQFFIVFYPRFALDRKYTNFGRVIGNMEAVDAIARGEPPVNPTRIVQASIAADGVQAPAMAPVDPVGKEITADMLSNSASK
jgi:peptidylprolyl isomerase